MCCKFKYVSEDVAQYVIVFSISNGQNSEAWCECFFPVEKTATQSNIWFRLIVRVLSDWYWWLISEKSTTFYFLEIFIMKFLFESQFHLKMQTKNYLHSRNACARQRDGSPQKWVNCLSPQNSSGVSEVNCSISTSGSTHLALKHGEDDTVSSQGSWTLGGHHTSSIEAFKKNLCCFLCLKK